MSTEEMVLDNGFTKDTYVLTENGPIQISKIKKNTKLYTYEVGIGYVLKTISTNIQKIKNKCSISSVIINNGLSINCTSNQSFMRKIMSSKLSCCKTHDLTNGTLLMSYGTSSVKDSVVEEITHNTGKDTVYTIKSIPTYNFIICDKDGNNGVVVVL